MDSMIAAWGVGAEPAGDQPGGVLDLLVQLQQLAGHPGDQYGSRGLGW
jgi:hypothetical protein